MNSVTPIISLSKLIQETLAADSGGADAPALTVDARSDLLRSANAVHSRSSGLLDFVKAYRSFATVPVPVFSDFAVLPLLERVRTLMTEALSGQHVSTEVECEGGLMVHADQRQVEQVLINLMRNAIEVVGEVPQAQVVLRAARSDNGRIGDSGDRQWSRHRRGAP